ncbi:MAG TPA: HTTM domain-containing protein [Polyangiaceae bacterium]|nr:HTTM domain-containing protein [Polyangiaceae bacterium]
MRLWSKANGARCWRSAPAPSVLTLALTRVVVCCLVLGSEELQQARSFAATASVVRAPAQGLSWLVNALPCVNQSTVLLQWAVMLGAVLGALGLFTRWALCLTALPLTLVFALPHFAGAPRHSMHIVWLFWILCLSPCARVFSLDCCARRHWPSWPSQRSSGAETQLALGAIWACLAAVYFFPGLWKLVQSGPAWVFSSNLQNQMYYKWAQFGVVPELRPDRHPWLMHWGAAGVVLFELAFPLLMLTRATRLLAAVGGLVFHELAARTMYLGFSALTWCYVALVDWSALSSWLRRGVWSRQASLPPAMPVAPVLTRIGKSALRLRRAWPLALVAAVVVVGTWVQGARGQMRAYPFACYPTFQWLAADRMPDLLITVVRDDGEHPVVDGPASGGVRTQYLWGIAWRALGAYDGRPDQRALKAYLELLLAPGSAERGKALAGGRAVRFYRADVDIRPGHWSDIVSSVLLFELRL